MVPTSVDHLPVELHIFILKFLLSSLRQSASLVPVTDDDPKKYLWKELNLRSASLFPFNVASVCKQWRDILVQIPECWTRVIFDLARDSTTFLDAFSWSKGLEGIEVVVFNSSGLVEHVEEAQKSLEYGRVLTVVDALRPHIHRCKSITFDIIYSSSLPPPTLFFRQNLPNLERLRLDCRVDNITVRVGEDTRNIKYKDLPRLAKSFPKLMSLSLQGYWFMYLGLTPGSQEWFKEVKFNRFISFRISQFEFSTSGLYSMPNFVWYLSEMATCYDITFRDLSLGYPYGGFESMAHKLPIIAGYIHFHSVSKDFLAHLYAITDFSREDILSFEACQIPKIHQFPFGCYLMLTNIIEDNQANSLRHILESWRGGQLTVKSCPSFDDTLLSWLGSEVQNIPGDSELDDAMAVKTFPAEDLKSLAIKDCNNFTPRVLRNLIKARNDTVLVPRPIGMWPIWHLEVGGRGPLLSQEDRDWFKENTDTISVKWKTENEQGISEDFCTNYFAIS